ncbi:MAG: hypothetical protein AAFX41_06290, partial [Bacteroidota bacterium]
MLLFSALVLFAGCAETASTDPTTSAGITEAVLAAALDSLDAVMQRQHAALERIRPLDNEE